MPKKTRLKQAITSSNPKIDIDTKSAFQPTKQNRLSTAYMYRAYCVAVYDGDTITLDIDLGFGVWLRKQRIRLYGINAPEVRGETRARGIAARDYLRSLILDKFVILHSIEDKKGKYGRWLGVIRARRDNDATFDVNHNMIQTGHAEDKDYD